MNVSGVESAQYRSHFFANLAARYPDSAVGQGVPLVMWNDVVVGELARMTNHHRDFFSLYVAQRGRGTHFIGESGYAVVRGDVYVMWPGMAHRFSGSDDLVFDTIHFQAEVFDEATRDILARTPGFQALLLADSAPSAGPESGARWLHLTPGAYETVATLLHELRGEWRAGTPDGALLVRALFLRLLVFLARERARTAPTDAAIRNLGHAATVAAAVRFMEERFADSLKVEQVAAAVFLSPDRFTEVFSATMGRTPRDYLRHLRIERAQHLLKTTDRTVAAIAADAGFADAAHLTRVLRAATGRTPSQLRAEP